MWKKKFRAKCVFSLAITLIPTSASGLCNISSHFWESPFAAALTNSSFTSPETCVSNNFFKSALKRSEMIKSRYDVPVPGCFKEFSATYYHISTSIYAIKSFILNNPILYVFLCVK